MPNLAYTWTTLRAALLAWPETTNTEYTNSLDTIIGLGERRLVRDLNLEIFDHVTTLSLAEDTRTVAKPDDWITTRSLRLSTIIDGEVGFVAGSQQPIDPTVSVDNFEFEWAEAYAARNTAGALGVVAVILRTSGASTYPDAVIMIGGVEADYVYATAPVGFGSGNSHLLLATAPLAQMADATVTIEWDPVDVEMDYAITAWVHDGVAEDFSLADSYISATSGTSMGTFEVTPGQAVIAVAGQYTGGDFSPQFVAGETFYEMFDADEYYSGHQFGAGYRLVSTAGSETIETTNDIEFAPGIAALLPALSVTGRSYPLEQRSWDFCNEFAPDASLTARPRYFNEVNSEAWELVPTADQNYGVTVRYVRLPQDSLASTTPNDTSWLSRSVPDALFAACLMEAEHFLKADDRYGDYQAKYEKELLPNARAELRGLIRAGDYTPFKPAAQKAG